MVVEFPSRKDISFVLRHPDISESRGTCFCPNTTRLADPTRGLKSEWSEGSVSLMPSPDEAAVFFGGALALGAAAFGIVRAFVKRRPQGSQPGHDVN